MTEFPAAHALLQQAITARAFPGAAYGILLRGQVLATESVGRFTYDLDAPAMLPETIFDMASVSKVLGTTALAMLLCERGQLALDAPIAERLPKFVQDEPADSLKRTITARMLLAHSSGLPAYARLYETCKTGESLLGACLRMPLEAAPGTQAVYSDIGFIVLGHLLEQLASEPLDRYCQREVFAPLAMGSTLYRPALEMRPAIPPTAIDDAFRHRLIQGEVHDENCWVLGGVSGHAGIFSSVQDTLRFAACILRGGAPVFRSATISVFAERQSQPAGSFRALGWDTPSPPSSSGSYFSTRSIGHLGYTGTSLWIDLEKEMAIVLLTNRTFPGNGTDGISNAIQQVRPRFHDAVLHDVGLSTPLS